MVENNDFWYCLRLLCNNFYFELYICIDRIDTTSKWFEHNDALHAIQSNVGTKYLFKNKQKCSKVKFISACHGHRKHWLDGFQHFYSVLLAVEAIYLWMGHWLHCFWELRHFWKYITSTLIFWRPILKQTFHLLN